MVKTKSAAQRGAQTMKVVLSPEEKAKAKARTARFGTASEEDKVKNRKARFSEDPRSDEAKKLARAQRFAARMGGTLDNNPEELEKRKKRAERFGGTIPEVEEDRKRQRLERFKVGDKCQETIDQLNSYLSSKGDEPATADVQEVHHIAQSDHAEGTAEAPYHIDASSS